MEDKRTVTVKIEHAQERNYIPVPFDMPENVERVDVRYAYKRHASREENGFELRENSCVIDLAIEGPNGEFAGASGSDRTHVWLSPMGSSAGYVTRELTPGVWRIVAGAYRIPEDGVAVEFEIAFTYKRRRLFCGDTHTHTTASDGAADIAGTVELARQQKLDFVFITDHNNFPAEGAIPVCEDITVLPGTEWTHYEGHAGFLGAKRAFYSHYYTASHEETQTLFLEAKSNGAMVILNHPFCPSVPWLWGFELPYDAVEVWNGVMSERNERAIRHWHARLVSGDKRPAIGGSDYHRAGLLGGVAMPCMCLYAPSRSPQDIMRALRHGSGYISYLADGPGADVRGAGGLSFGDTVKKGSEVAISLFSLWGKDEIKLITDLGEESIRCPENAASYTLTCSFPGARFLRLEVFRSYAPGLPPMRAMLTNSIYFE